MNKEFYTNTRQAIDDIEFVYKIYRVIEDQYTQDELQTIIKSANELIAMAEVLRDIHNATLDRIPKLDI